MTISEIKREAKSKLQGKILKSCAIYLVYSLIVGLLQAVSIFFSSDTLRIIYSLIIIVISLPFSYGAIAQLIKLSRGEDASVTGFINIGLQNLGKVWGILGRTLLKLIVPIILYILSIVFLMGVTVYSFAQNFSTDSVSNFGALSLVAFVLLIAALIYLVAKSLLYYLTTYILYDNQEATSKEIVEKSAELMTGNRWKYIGFVLSFIGWYLLIYVVSLILICVNPILGAIAMLIFALILMQYITFATIVFYEDLAGITSNTEVKE